MVALLRHHPRIRARSAAAAAGASALDLTHEVRHRLMLEQAIKGGCSASGDFLADRSSG